MASETVIRRRQSSGLGRSGPRSKNGCQACKLRRVRCDESKPVCSHCDRLKLECVYRPPQRRSRRTASESQSISTEPDIMDSVNAASESWNHDEDAGFAGVDDAQDPAVASLQALSSPGLEAAAALATSNHPRRESHSLHHAGAINCTLTPVSTGESVMQHISDAALVDVLPWHDQQMSFSDYIPVPDPIFSFPSLAFTNSANLLNFEYDPDTHSMPLGPVPAQIPAWQFAPTVPSIQGQTLPAIHDGEQGPPRPAVVEAQSSISPSAAASSLSPPFTYCPPLLSPERRQELLSYFEREIRPPAALVGVDPLGWPRIKRFLLKEARGSSNEYVNLALCALTTIMMAPTTSVRGRMNGHNEALLAARLHEAARTAMEIELTQADWATKKSNPLLVATFLMAWFETGFDDRDQIRPHFPSDIAEQIIVKGTDWCAGSMHLLQWLNLLDAKMSHLGGHHLLTEPALKVALQSRPQIGHADVANDEDASDEYSEVTSHSISSRGRSTTQSKGPRSRDDRLAYLLATKAPASIPPRIVKTDIFKILLQPAFEFHLVSQAFSRRIGCHDRHHRSRETPEDEYEVMTACMGFEDDLQELWRKRPGILNLTANQLKQFVSESIARRLEQLFSVYIATFWTHFVYIHRVAYWSMKHTPISSKALDETGKMMRRSVGQPVDELAFDPDMERTAYNVIHPGLLWTCFLFGCEVQDPVQQDWSVQQLRALGELDLVVSGPKATADGADGHPMDGAGLVDDELPTFRLDKKGAQNALKVSSLLRLLIDQQVRRGQRVDGKFLCQEMFGCHFYII
ncbi:hypothetical protein F5X68DRAFT_172963 [Plectosphaerella plurivora]|uniref:Zn(2)-C6 fungal-type domain-containing protein n=1 Tax=Plectosphaerella plurivora TaxID=936078 RepID=A0A9P8V7E2_9PEZI|nr:hypothetical protein F5X68DRAFT_172963 [Plectosphaerella plurivora]